MSDINSMDADTMAHEKGITHMEKVDSQDEMHRNVVGHDAEELQGYWTSWPLMGSVLAIVLMGNSLFVGYAMPVSRFDILQERGSNIILRSTSSPSSMLISAPRPISTWSQ